MQTKVELDAVNAAINKLPYVAELTDDWRPIDEWGGDCDSYATAKMLKLYQLGWPIESMRLAECKINAGGLHCVLLVDLDGETWNLDNRYPFPKLKDFTPYTWTRIQIAGTPDWETA